MKVFINEFDRDYGTVTDSITKEFQSIQEADIWCKENSWSGYHYYVDTKMTQLVNEEKTRE